MDPDLYKAAKYGKIEAFKKTNNSDLQLDQLLTPDKNTVLHIHITSLTTDRKTSFVEEILKICPWLLKQPNNKGDIPLHMAARYGHNRLVKLLIERAKADNDIESGEAAKEMVRAENFANETALHEAVRFGHFEVVRALVAEDSSGVHEYGANEDGETPLYMAAERNHGKLVSLMLEKCSPSPATSGPRGRTVLHAVVINNNAVMTRKILEKMRHLTTKADDRGWVPLHFAPHQNLMRIATDLLRWDRDAAYIKDRKGRTPLHLAASNGYHKMMSEILSSCPDCGELVDDRRWNGLHYAVNSNKWLAVRVILRDSSLSNLLNGKDIEGNTPLHVSATKLYSRSILVSHSAKRVDKMAFNKKNQTTSDILFIKHPRRMWRIAKLLGSLLPGNRILIYKDEDCPKEIEEQEDKDEDPKASFEIEKTRESTLVVATLIATITFAAGFTLPGGYVDDEGPLRGMAILRQNPAFQAFMITDTIAMALSSASVLTQMFLNLQFINRTARTRYQSMAHRLTIFSMMAMVIAFISGTYAVLAPTVALAVVTCIIGLSFFGFYLYFSLIMDI